MGFGFAICSVEGKTTRLLITRSWRKVHLIRFSIKWDKKLYTYTYRVQRVKHVALVLIYRKTKLWTRLPHKNFNTAPHAFNALLRMGWANHAQDFSQIRCKQQPSKLHRTTCHSFSIHPSNVARLKLVAARRKKEAKRAWRAFPEISLFEISIQWEDRVKILLAEKWRYNRGVIALSVRQRKSRGAFWFHWPCGKRALCLAVNREN